MELVYLWVEDYKNIQKQGFNFSPRFECKFYDEYDENGNLKDNCELEIKPKEHIKNFFGKNINVTAIVGENGSGKSSLINFIVEQNEHFGIFVFKHKDKLFIFYKNMMKKTIKIHSDLNYELNSKFLKKYGTSLLFLKSYMDINTYKVDEQLTIPRKYFHFSEKRDFLSDLHKNTIELVNIISINSKKHIDDSFETSPYSIMALNQHFSYLKEKYSHKILKYYPELEEFIGQYFNVDKVEYKLRDLGSIFLASPAFKDNYKEDNFLNNMFSAFNEEEYIESRLKILCLIFSYLDEEKIKEFILKNQKSLSYSELYNLIEKQKYSYVISWNDFINVIGKKSDFKTIIKEYLVFIKKIRREILEFSFSPSLSSGEEKLLYLFISIYDCIIDYEKVGTKEYMIIIDEPDTLLHPNWQKRIIFLIVTFVNKYFKNHIFNLIVTSHSPFILSDLPKENVIFLEKDEKTGHCINATDQTNIHTFGANIHTLLSHGFFMKNGLMGEFAKSKIDEAIKYLNQKTLSSNEIDYCEDIISIIGEPILKRQLQKILDSKRLYIVDDINQKIKDMEYELSVLKKYQKKATQDELKDRAKRKYTKKKSDENE